MYSTMRTNDLFVKFVMGLAWAIQIADFPKLLIRFLSIYIFRSKKLALEKKI
jgi:hypothetical protein